MSEDAGNADVPVGMELGKADEDVGAPREKPPGNADVPVGTEFGKADVPVGTEFGKADEDVGAPRENMPGGKLPKGWYSRGYLPHRDHLRLVQSITFRLADSLPKDVLARLNEELQAVPEAKRDRERRKRIEDWLDSGSGCCALQQPEVAAYVQNALLHFHGERYRLYAWCLMPNHVHVLVKPFASLGTVVQGWKSFTGRWALANNARLELGIAGKQFWMRDYWDRFIRDEDHFANVLNYLHENPVKAGLCQRAEDWVWSSAHPGNADVLVGLT